MPDFQRSWVWDEDRIKSLIASISRAFPVGALMTLDTGGPVNFKPRPIEGAPEAANRVRPQSLLLDGQQRMTSLYQVILRKQVVKTFTAKNKEKQVPRWFYIDMRRAMDPQADREEAILAIPEDKIVRGPFGALEKDYSTDQLEYEHCLYPMTQVFDSTSWLMGFNDFWKGKPDGAEAWSLFKAFQAEVLESFKYYQVPVITLESGTSKEAVCTVFEKVNTGGKPLDAFELVTAMYAADGHELRKDWLGDVRTETQGRRGRFQEYLRAGGSEKGILADVASTDFLQVVSLFFTRHRREAARAQGKAGKELPAVSCNRDSLLNLPWEAYDQYQAQVERGFEKAAKFLHLLHIFRIADLPYQSQIVPLAAILAEIGDAWEHEGFRQKLVRWYWCGVFGELYGASVETRSAKDFVEVPTWIKGGKEPSTVSESLFRPDRLKTMRMRLSAAYKGVNALLMREGAEDLRSGQRFGEAVFFGEAVDIHHIFPKKWCIDHGIEARVFDSIINKTPLAYRTNRILGGDAPSAYLERLQQGSADSLPILPYVLDDFLRSHLIEPLLLRSNNFDAFMSDREDKLEKLINKAMGKTSYAGLDMEEGSEHDDAPDS